MRPWPARLSSKFDQRSEFMTSVTRIDADVPRHRGQLAAAFGGHRPLLRQRRLDASGRAPLPELLALGTLGSTDEAFCHVQAAYRYFAGQMDVIHDGTLVGPRIF